jgi:hypothetical protein
VRPARARTVLRHLRWLVPAALALALPAAGTADPPPASSNPAYRVLVFTKTAGERHASIPAGVAAIRKLGYPAGTHKLYLVFRSIPGGPTTNLFNLNWFEFGGQGVGTP